MDKHEKNTILTIQDDEGKEQHHDATRRKKEWNEMNGGKQDLERARLQQMLEQSCWKTTNEKNKLDMVLWNTCQIMR